MEIQIRPVLQVDAALLHAHMARHLAESGGAMPHFLPYAPNSAEMPTAPDLDRLELGLAEPKWARWFLAEAEGKAVGHLSLKGGGLRAALHRCELGVGLEAAYRTQGLGRRLMRAGIEYAKASEQLAWIDLQVFAHNTSGIALYRSLGFAETGRYLDRFRLEGKKIDDVSMSLSVG